jgi:predicted transposase/invertase (TIGR01784 family)
MTNTSERFSRATHFSQFWQLCVLTFTARMDTFAAMKKMAVHDHSYKLLFSHARMMRDLLEGFIGGEWLRAVDFSTLERVSDAYVTDDLRARADDIVWRIRCGQRYVYLLLEFQSSPEPFMAVRVLTYVGLLYQDLIKAQEIRRGGRLPNVLPVVLYNGASRWHAAEDVSTLWYDSRDDLEKYRPSLRYLLIDEGAYDHDRLALHGNLVALLFRLENCFQRNRVKELVTELIEELRGPELESLRRAFAIWLQRVIFTRFSGASVDLTNDLWGVERMLAERVPIWEEELRQEGEFRILTRLLRKRFGELPESIFKRLQAATCQQLEHWGERLLEVTTLSELFQGEPAP